MFKETISSKQSELTVHFAAQLFSHFEEKLNYLKWTNLELSLLTDIFFV